MAGRIAAVSLRSESGGATSLERPENAIDRFAATAGGDVSLKNSRALVIGGRDGLAPDITLATLQGFGGGRALNIGVPAAPVTGSPFAGNVRVMSTRGCSFSRIPI